MRSKTRQSTAYLTSVLCLLLLISVVTSKAATEAIVQVSDISEGDAPLKVSGKITFKDDESQELPYSVHNDITFVNVSNKPILLSIVRVELISTHVRSSDIETDDYFFQPHVLVPGSTAHLAITLPIGRSSVPYQPVRIKASAKAKVVFVQFTDGLTWGDPSSANRNFQERARSMRVLQSLSELYRTGSEEDFVTALLQTTELQAVLTLQDLYQKDKNATEVVAKLDEMLQSAKLHAASLETIK